MGAGASVNCLFVINKMEKHLDSLLKEAPLPLSYGLFKESKFINN